MCPLYLSYAVAFITLYLSHFPVLCGNKSIHIFIHFSNNSVTYRVTSESPHTQFYFWWFDRMRAEDNSAAERSFCFFYLIWAPLRGSAHTSRRVFVYSRERMWSKMASIAQSFPRVPPPTTSGCVVQRADTQSVNLLFIMESDFPWDTAVYLMKQKYEGVELNSIWFLSICSYGSYGSTKQEIQTLL